MAPLWNSEISSTLDVFLLMNQSAWWHVLVVREAISEGPDPVGRVFRNMQMHIQKQKNSCESKRVSSKICFICACGIRAVRIITS
jgi:hypothetical protein